MLRKDVLFDSPFGIVRIWGPERQFFYPNGGAIQSLPATIKAVIVESWAGGWSPGEVIRVRPFELRLRGFRMKEDAKDSSGKEKEAEMILDDLSQEESYGKRDELLSRFILNRRDCEMNSRAALLWTRQIASTCNPPIPDEHAKELFWEIWNAVEPEDTPVPRMKDLLYIAQKEIAELKSERARLRTTLQAAVMKLDALRGK